MRPAEQTGFPAVYLGGFGVAASLLGRPDIGLVTAAELSGHALLFNRVEGGRSAGIGLDRLAELGYRLVISPVTALLAATPAIRGALESFRDRGSAEPAALESFEDFLTTIGLPGIREQERRFSS